MVAIFLSVIFQSPSEYRSFLLEVASHSTVVQIVRRRLREVQCSTVEWGCRNAVRDGRWSSRRRARRSVYPPWQSGRRTSPVSHARTEYATILSAWNDRFHHVTALADRHCRSGLYRNNILPVHRTKSHVTKEEFPCLYFLECTLLRLRERQDPPDTER